MSRIRIAEKDPWTFVRDNADTDVSVFMPPPKIRASMTIATSEGIRVGWSLFWRSLWWTIRRHPSIDFWMEGDR